jgi:hypothetical protein
MVENNGGQKVCITAWQFSAFNLSRNRCPHSKLSYSINLLRLVPNPGKFFKKICYPILIIWAIFVFSFYYKMWVQFTGTYSLNQWNPYVFIGTYSLNLWNPYVFIGPDSLQLMNSLKIQWNLLTNKDTFSCSNLNSKIWHDLPFTLWPLTLSFIWAMMMWFQPLISVKRFWFHCEKNSKVALMTFHSLMSIRVL